MQPFVPWMENAKEVDPSKVTPLHAVPTLHSKMKTLLQKNGYEELLAAQWALWDMTAAGKNRVHDVCLSFPTGSGKTLAYLLPIFQTLIQQGWCGVHCLRALIIVPTNTLAHQVSKVTQKFARELDLRVGLLGIASISDEAKMLSSKTNVYQGMVDILISTPGRLLTHLDHTPHFSLKCLQYLVLDEADHLMKRQHQDFLPELMRHIQQDTQSMITRVQKMVISATISFDVVRLRMLDLCSPRLICSVGSKSNRYQFPATLEHFKLVVPAPLRPLALAGLLHKYQMCKVVVFCSTLEMSQKLREMLSSMCFLKDRVVECCGDLPKSRISQAMRKIQKRECAVLVCSDMISRGMDLADVNWVIHYDTPKHAKAYVHRVGRTARIGKRGNSCCLVRKGVDEISFNNMIKKLNVETQDFKLDVEDLRKLKPELDSVLTNMCEKSHIPK